MKKKEGLKERFYKFALRIIKFVKGLPKEMAAYEIGKQLLRSGTSIAANYEEATGAFSSEEIRNILGKALLQQEEENLNNSYFISYFLFSTSHLLDLDSLILKKNLIEKGEHIHLCPF